MSRKPPPLQWQAHQLVEGAAVQTCTICGRVWKNGPLDCPGLPVYQWGAVPDGLFTLRQLDEKRLIAGEPRGLLFYSKTADSYLRLYLESEATPKKPLTEKQQAAIAHLKLINSPQYKRMKELEYVRDTARKLLASEFVVIDSETCDLWAGSGIVELAVIDQTGKTLFDSRINPLRPIARGAQDVHGISAEDLIDAPTFFDVYPQLAAAIDGKTWVGYNIGFDTEHITEECSHFVLPGLRPAGENGRYYGWDVMELYAIYWGDYSSRHRDYRWQKLSDARWRHNLDTGGAGSHSALGDVRATLALLEFLAQIDVKAEWPDELHLEHEREKLGRFA